MCCMVRARILVQDQSEYENMAPDAVDSTVTANGIGTWYGDWLYQILWSQHLYLPFNNYC